MFFALRMTLARAGRLARVAAGGPGLWKGLALYALTLGLGFVGVWVSIRMIAWSKAFYDALEALDAAEAAWQVGVFFLLIGLSAASWLAADWLQKRLYILWRARLTAQALDLWIGNRAYWLLRPGFGETAIDNPDQRVAEDCRLFVDRFLLFTLDLVQEVVSLVSFVAILWGLSTFALSFTAFGLDITIPRYMFWLAPVYAVAATFIAHGLGFKPNQAIDLFLYV